MIHLFRTFTMSVLQKLDEAILTRTHNILIEAILMSIHNIL